MLRLDSDRLPSLWDSVLPPELFQMSEELARIDKIFMDDRFFMPFVEKFYTCLGRKTAPVTTYLRMMCLKRHYGLSYENTGKRGKWQLEVAAFLPSFH